MHAKHAFIDAVREENEQDFGPKARIAVQKLLDAGLPHPWMYVYELTQNAADAGARRVCWRIDGDTVTFQHDGNEALNETHVRALCSLGGSTKGLATVGYMGVGFKSVFSRFRLARVAGFGWRFRFQIHERHGDLQVAIPEWLDTLRPCWDDEEPSLEPDAGFTTIFQLAQSAHEHHYAGEDLARLASADDPTPLAVLALRGLEEVQIGDVIWRLAVDNGQIEVRRCEAGEETTWRWKAFRAAYQPDDDAMRRFLEVRQQLHDDLDGHGDRIMRQVVALLPLDSEGRPEPPTHGRVYATLPTQITLPFGFHLQADWLVNVDRQNLRDVAGDPWQMAIINQIPNLIKQLLQWLARESEEVRRQGYPALCDPMQEAGLLAQPCQNLRTALQQALADQPIAPIHGTDPRAFRCPSQTARLPARFQTHFGQQSKWRVEQLFGIDLLDETILGNRGTAFARWLEWGREIEVTGISWPATLPAWWEALDRTDRADALFALWDGVRFSGWDEAPVVPTAAGTWVNATAIQWLNEEPPSDKEPGGPAVAAALRDFLPPAERRLPAEIRQAVQQRLPTLRYRRTDTESNGVRWLWERYAEVKLADLVQQVCHAAAAPDTLPLIEWLGWALHRGLNRQDLLPLVLTESGARKPQEALLADPLLTTGHSRRRIFPNLPVLVADYAALPDPRTTSLFLDRLGVQGKLQLIEKSQSVCSRSQVATLLEVAAEAVEPANSSGYTIMDWAFPFDVAHLPADALQDWLTREYHELKEKGRCWAESAYYGNRRTRGSSLCVWVQALQNHPWVRCVDGERRKPGEILLAPDLDFEEAPVAEIDSGLAQRLTSEGLRFGYGIPKAPTLRRLIRKGAIELPDGELAALLTEAREAVALSQATPEEFDDALQTIRLRGVTPLDRLAKRTGAGVGLRGNLDGWVLAMTELEPALVAALESLPLTFPATTTGQQALAFLEDLWIQPPTARLDDLRRHVAAAYRYVLDDLNGNDPLAQNWRAAQNRVQVYGGRAWRPIGPRLAVDDVQSPWIRSLLPDHRTLVAPGYLGDTGEQARRVARALGLKLLSDEVQVRPGRRGETPSFTARLQSLLNGLSSLNDRKLLTDVHFHDSLRLEISGTEHTIRAFIDGQTLRLAGKPSEFAAEAASQLVEYFQLSQKGDEIPWLTMALAFLEDEPVFNQYIDVLGKGLGIDPAVWIITRAAEEEAVKDHSSHQEDVSVNTDDTTTVHTSHPGPAPQGGSVFSGHRNHGGNASTGTERQGETGTSASAGRNSSRTVTGRAADHFRGLVINRHDPSAGNVAGELRSDETTRAIVLKYEAAQGRNAEPMDASQPGYDILSEDPVTGQRRRIEVKGVQGYYEGDASVVLSARQVEDAIYCTEPNTEYWLYVVDASDTDEPRIWPMPWTRYRQTLRYGFYASAWVDIAEQPVAVTPDNVTSLNSSSFRLDDLLDPNLYGDTVEVVED